MSSSNDSLLHRTLADIVTADSRSAAVFERAGLDYCCRGHQTLAGAAAARGLDAAAIIADLDVLASEDADGQTCESWPDLSLLITHIVTKHHAYVRATSPVLTAWLDKLVTRHGGRHPELGELRDIFAAMSADMASHMVKEEHILFPFIGAIATAYQTGQPLPTAPFGSIQNPIRMMECDHEGTGAELERMRALTENYAPPADACTTFRMCYEELARFEADMHRHVHLENHVLFPRAVRMEASVV